MLNSRTAREAVIRRGVGHGGRSSSAGFTLVELLMTLIIFMIVAAMAVPALRDAIKSARTARSVADVRTIGMAAYGYYAQTGYAPPNLAEIGFSQQIDGWGHPYQYLPFPPGTIPANARTDGFGVAVNQYFDLYSKGADGVSSVSLTDAQSVDDVVWAEDGFYIGTALNY